MKAVTWQGKQDVRVEEVPDPTIAEPTDAIVRITTTNICGSDLHLYEPLAAFMGVGDILGHESMGIVEEVGADCGDLRVGDRVSIPFQISCGHCWMCAQHLYTQCETTQVRERSTCGFPRPSSPTSSSQRVLPTTGSPTSRTSCRPHGRGWSTQRFRTAAPSSCSASVRWATSPAGSARTGVTA